VINKRLSVREAEKLVTATLQKSSTESASQRLKPGNRDIAHLEEELSDALAADVKIKLGRKGNGTLAIAFGNRDALEGIIERLRGE
jgi:ParB family chromosome partitioning protein